MFHKRYERLIPHASAPSVRNRIQLCVDSIESIERQERLVLATPATRRRATRDQAPRAHSKQLRSTQASKPSPLRLALLHELGRAARMGGLSLGAWALAPISEALVGAQSISPERELIVAVALTTHPVLVVSADRALGADQRRCG